MPRKLPRTRNRKRQSDNASDNGHCTPEFEFPFLDLDSSVSGFTCHGECTFGEFVAAARSRSDDSDANKAGPRADDSDANGGDAKEAGPGADDSDAYSQASTLLCKEELDKRTNHLSVCAQRIDKRPVSIPSMTSFLQAGAADNRSITAQNASRINFLKAMGQQSLIAISNMSQRCPHAIHMNLSDEDDRFKIAFNALPSTDQINYTLRQLGVGELGSLFDTNTYNLAFEMVMEETELRRCSMCNKLSMIPNDEIKYCKGCRVTQYCSKDCQVCVRVCVLCLACIDLYNSC